MAVAVVDCPAAIAIEGKLSVAPPPPSSGLSVPVGVIGPGDAVVLDEHRDADGGLDRAVGGGGQVGVDRRVGEVARADRPERDLAVDAAEVEPRPVEAGRALGGGVAVVGADDERVGAGRRLEAEAEREVRADVGVADLGAVDPDRGALVDGLEVELVDAVGRDRELRPVPGDRALEVLDPGRAGHRLGIGVVGDGDRRADEVAGRPVVVVAVVVGVQAADPVVAEGDPVGRTLLDPGLLGDGQRVGRGAAGVEDAGDEEDEDDQSRSGPAPRRRRPRRALSRRGARRERSTRVGARGLAAWLVVHPR